MADHQFFPATLYLQQSLPAKPEEAAVYLQKCCEHLIMKDKNFKLICMKGKNFNSTNFYSMSRARRRCKTLLRFSAVFPREKTFELICFALTKPLISL